MEQICAGLSLTERRHNIWGTYITDLKNDAKDLKDAVNAAGTYDQIINFDFTWTTPPDATI